MVSPGVGFVFFFVAALWAYYHLVKQHYGFMVLYKKKNGDLATYGQAARPSVSAARPSQYPFVAFVARDPEAMGRVPARLHGGVGDLKHCCSLRLSCSRPWLARQTGSARLGGAASERSEVPLARGGDSDALGRAADADAAQAHRHRRDTNDLSQPAIPSPDLVSQPKVHKRRRTAESVTARRS